MCDLLVCNVTVVVINLYMLILHTDVEDLRVVMEYTCDLSQTQLFELGIQLGLHFSTLRKLRENSPNLLRMEMMNAWLSRQDSVKEIGIPSWRVLVIALRKKPVNCNLIADTIEKKFLPN